MTDGDSLRADLARVLSRHGYHRDDADAIPDLLAALVRALASLRSADAEQPHPYEIRVELPRRTEPAPAPAVTTAPWMLLTLSEAADNLRISRTKLYELLDAGEITRCTSAGHAASPPKRSPISSRGKPHAARTAARSLPD